MTTTPLVFLDTETTGIHPGRLAWEIGMIRRDETGQHEHHLFIDVDLTDAEPFALRLGGFWDRHPLGRHLAAGAVLGGIAPPEPKELPIDLVTDPAIGNGDYVSRRAAAHIVAAVTHNAHIVGAVPSFDTETLTALLRECWLTPSWHYHLIDVQPLAIGYLNGHATGADIAPTGVPLAPPWRSDDLGESLGVVAATPEERHTALGDARWAMRMYDRIIGGQN